MGEDKVTFIEGCLTPNTNISNLKPAENRSMSAASRHANDVKDIDSISNEVAEALGSLMNRREHKLNNSNG